MAGSGDAVRFARAAVTWLPLVLIDEAAKRGAFARHNAKVARVLVRKAVAERAELTRLLHLDEEAATSTVGSLAMVDADECLKLLSTRTVGRLAYVARAGVPDITPVNYSIDDDCILIRSGAGPKLQAAERRELVAFEVDDLDETDQSGWSVVVHGRAERIMEPNRGDAPGMPRPWAAGPRVHSIRITPRRITGRRITGRVGSSALVP